MLPFFIIASLLTFDALADNRERLPVYLRVDSGASLPVNSFHKIKNPYYKNGAVDRTWFGGVGIGYTFNKNIRTDVILTNRYLYTYHLTDHASSDQLSAKQNFSNTSLIANLYYDFDITTVIAPYINLGVGLSRNRSGELKDYYNGILDRSSKSGVKYDFAWNIGAGLQTKLTPNFYADIFFKYVDLGKFKRVLYTVHDLKTQELSTPGCIKNTELGVSIIYKF
jgi:opacity protein-like surface antigen